MADLQQTIERAKQQLEQMIDLAPQAMLLLDGENRIARANRSLLTLVGASSFDSVLGEPLADVLSLSPDWSLVSKGDGATHSVSDVDVVLEGQELTLQFTAIQSSSDSGMCVVMVEDITSDKADAARLAKEHKKQAVGALAGAMLHHLGQPLTVILARAQLMNLGLQQDTMGSEEMTASLDEIIDLTQSIARTLQEIEKPSDFVTCSYVGKQRILDLAESRGNSLSGAGFLDPLMAVSESHAPGQIGHGTRVAEYAGILAEEMGLESDEVGVIRRCGYLHDIGKIGIADAILQKPSELDEVEMTAMRKHSDIGYSLLSAVPALSAEAEVAHSHHERHDGRGYPRRIAGDRIGMRAKIVSVADALDALHTGRPYHTGISFEDAAAKVYEGSGTHFDPQVIDAMKSAADRMSQVA